MAKQIKVVKPVKPKRRRKPKKTAARRKPRKTRKGKAHYSSFFPTNRQIDSNQYWQLRAEIAGAEARVRSSLKDRQDDEKKADKKVEKLEKEVKEFTTVTPADRRTRRTPGTPAGDEYDDGNRSVSSRNSARDDHTVDLTAERASRRSPKTPPPLPPVEHRGETFEDKHQRTQEQLRGAVKLQGALTEKRQRVTTGNILSRWRTVSETGKIKKQLRDNAEAITAHNVESTDPNTPTKKTVESVVEHGAPPAVHRSKKQARAKVAELTPRTRGMMTGGAAPSAGVDSPYARKSRGISSEVARSPKVTLSPALQAAVDREVGRSPGS
jgi:hypothetical protein